MSNIGILLDDRYRLHDPGSRHPESPDRLTAIRQAVEPYSGISAWRRVEPRPAETDELLRIHRPELIERIERASERAPCRLDPDTAVSCDSYRTALLAAGGVLACTDEICAGRIERAFAFVRPPGHHAEPARAMGFCLFNNVALAAAHARVRHGLERIAIVDIDLHHGNGTQASFYDDPHVLYISTHQFPYYPGTGSFQEAGVADGKGFTLNFPLPAGTGDETVVPLYSKVIAAALEQYRPQLVLVSAGFDAYFRDPLGGLQWTEKGYGSVAASLVGLADSCCEGRILFVLEGGYSPEGLQGCTRAVMSAMETAAAQEPELPGDELFHQICAFTRRIHGGFWKW